MRALNWPWFFRYLRWRWVEWLHLYCDINPKTLTAKRNIKDGELFRVCGHCHQRIQSRV